MQTTVKIEGEDEFKRKMQQAQDFLNSGDILEIVAIESINHFKQSFEDEGFTDRSLEKWGPEKQKDFHEMKAKH